MESGIEEMSFEEYCNVFNDNNNDFSMIRILEEEFLDKIIEIQDFDKEVRKLLLIGKNESIFSNDIRDSIHNGCYYNSVFSNKSGYEFKFELAAIDREEQELFIKVVDVAEV